MTLIRGYQDLPKEFDDKIKEKIVTPKKLPWSHEVVDRIKNEPRQAQESPLKQWWLSQQQNKTKTQP